MQETVIAMMLQCCPLDQEEAIELAQLIADIEPVERKDVEFVLATRRDVARDVAQMIRKIVAPKFARFAHIECRRYGTGHPDGCNDLWQDSMMQIGDLKLFGQLRAEAVLTFEPDCCPLRPDWLNRMILAWKTAKEADKCFTGSVCSPSEDYEHINGNAIFCIDALRRFPKLCSSNGNWDIAHRHLIVANGIHTNAIEQRYGTRDPLSVEFVRELRNKMRQPALLHGVKNDSARRAIRTMMEDGTFTEPKPDPVRYIEQDGITFSISILAMDNLLLTERCIDSVMENSTRPFELLLWDNGSEEKVWDYFRSLREKYGDKITITHADKNIGFIEPNIQNLAMAKGRYFICLNNDATVPPGWLEALEEPFKRHADMAITGAHGCCQLHDNFHGFPGKVVEYIEGSCLCVRTDLARKHGLFAPYIHFAYGEDCDLSLRMRELGYQIEMTPMRIQHARSATSKKIPGILDIQKRNHDALQKRWGHYMKVRRMDYPIIVKRRAAIGDALLITPILRALKREKPLSPLLVETDFPELFANNPNLTGCSRQLGPHADALVINLDMAYEDRPMVNIVDAYHEVADTTSDGDDRAEILPNRQDVEMAADKLGRGKWCAIHCTPTTWSGKNWPEERFLEVTKWLITEGWQVVMVGNGDRTLKDFPYDLNLINETSISQLAAVLSQCELFIGHDSFPMHCALAVGIRTIGLFGISSSSIVIPKGATNALPIDADPAHQFTGARHRAKGETFIPCEDNPMLTISVEQVINAVKSI